MNTQAFDPSPPAPVLLADATPGERHSRGATRCGICGELTEAELCCGEVVW